MKHLLKKKGLLVALAAMIGGVASAADYNYVFAEVHTKRDMEFIIAEIKKFSR